MKKLISVLAALALVGSVAAQKGKKAPAKAPAVPAVAAPKAPAVPAAPVASKPVASATNFHIVLWGGYGIATASNFTKYPAGDFAKDSAFTTLSTTTDTQKRGGVAGGLELLYGSSFQFGLGAGYLTGMDNSIDYKDSSTGTVFKGTTKMNFLPVYALARLFVIEGLHIGAGFGVALINNGSQTVSGGTNGGSKVDYSGRMLTAVIKAGYDLKLSANLSLGLAVNAFYVFGNIPALYENAAGNYVSKDLNASHFNIVPSLAVSLSF